MALTATRSTSQREKNTVTVTVTAEDTMTEKTYTVNVNQGVTSAYGWKAHDDLDGLITAGNEEPRGIWSNGTTTWVVDSEDTFVYAYNRDGSRNTDGEFNLHSDNANPSGAWSNGQTAWISDNTDEKLYAYQVSNGERQDTLDLDLNTENANATGVWSDGTTMWVADFSGRKLYAYLLDGGDPPARRRHRPAKHPQSNRYLVRRRHHLGRIQRKTDHLGLQRRPGLPNRRKRLHHP